MEQYSTPFWDALLDQTVNRAWYYCFSGEYPNDAQLLEVSAWMMILSIILVMVVSTRQNRPVLNVFADFDLDECVFVTPDEVRS